MGPRARSLPLAILALLTACGGGEEPSFAPPPRAPGAPRPPEAAAPAAEGPWYRFEPPPGASPAVHLEPEVLDAVWSLDPTEHLGLTILRPIPAQASLDAFGAEIDRIFADQPALRSEPYLLDGLSGRLAITERALRLVLVADEHGIVLTCHAEEPREEAWLRERCGPALAGFHLVRPVHD